LISPNNKSNNIKNQRFSDNPLVISNNYNPDSNLNETGSPNPYRNRTIQNRKSESIKYNNHTKNTFFDSKNYTSFSKKKSSISKDKNNSIEDSDKNIFKNKSKKNKKEFNNKGINNDEIDNSNTSLINKSHNIYKNQKLYLSPNKIEKESEESYKINTRGSAEIPGNYSNYRRTKSNINLLLNKKNIF